MYRIFYIELLLFIKIDGKKEGLTQKPVKEISKSLIKEFKSFTMRGNVVDMTVGIIIGSLVSDILMPPIGVLIGGMDFSSLGITIKEATADHAAVVIKFGMFINILIDFLIVAFAMFLIIQAHDCAS